MPPWSPQSQHIIDDALTEDLAWGDITTETLIPSDWQAQASILIKKTGVLAGIEVAALVFHRVDPTLEIDILVKDGARVESGDRVARIRGKVASILRAERVALNFLGRLSGIATETARFVDAIAGLPVGVVDTRKTTPGLRVLEKYAVRQGGGQNHRLHLGDGILIKDNHLAALRFQGQGLKDAIAQARHHAPHTMRIEVEVETIEEAREALEAGADTLLLDNMSPEDMREVVALAEGQAMIEASGGITLDNVRSVAEAGVNLISIGALTHSARALDISLELEPLT